MIYYINIKTKEHGIETVDEFNSLQEAKESLIEYHRSPDNLYYYISSRSTADWRNR